MHLADLKNHILSHYLKMKKADSPLKDLSDLIFIPWILGAPLLHGDVENVIKEIQRLLNSSSPLPFHSYGMAIRALNMAGLTPPKDFYLPIHNWDQTDFLEWLDNLDWTKPWATSISILHAVPAKFQNRSLEKTPFFEALERHVNTEGGWGNDRFHGRMAAAFHFIPLYRMANRPMPELDAICRYLLRVDPRGGGFGAMDALYILWYAAGQNIIVPDEINRTDYERLLTLYPPEDRHQMVAYAQITSLLGLMNGEKNYRDAWAPDLWKTNG